MMEIGAGPRISGTGWRCPYLSHEVVFDLAIVVAERTRINADQPAQPDPQQ